MKGAAGVAAALLLACAGAGGVEKAELPPSPVALLQRSEEDALRRLDALRDLEKRRGETQAREGVAMLENLDALFGGAPELEHRLAAVAGHLVLLDPRTGATTRLESAPPQARPAAWSPDRRRLLVVGGWRDRRQLFAWDRESGRMDIETAGPAHHVTGCIAAGDRLVALEVDRASLAGAPSRLVASRPGGGALHPVGEPGVHVGLGCSPSRPEVAYVRLDAAQGRRTIHVRTLDPPGEPQEVAVGSSPVFTPDGEWIVYVAPTTRGSRIFRVRRDGAGRTPVGAGVLEESQPAVSPDGRYVAFVATEANGRERVWVRRMDGTGDRPLLTSGDAAAPVW